MHARSARVVIGAVFCACLTLMARPAHAQAELTMKIGDIGGSSPVEAGAIDVWSFSFGVSSENFKASAVKPTCSSFNVMLPVGPESGDLFLGVMLGTTYPTATFKSWKKGASGLYKAFELTFTNVTLTSLQQSGSAGGGPDPTQSLSLNGASVVLKVFGPTGVTLSEASSACGTTR
jgi:type VI protein secretion system component Hcp